MPAIAGLFENGCCPFRPTGSHQQASADGVTVVVLAHQQPTIVAEHVLNAYRNQGVSALHERAGDCAVALFDEVHQQLVLSRDAIGMHPLYYRQRGTKIAFGSRIIDALQAGGTVQPARRQLALRLVYGQSAFVGQTYFDDVRSIPPGHTLVFGTGRVQLLQRPFPTPPQNERISFQDAAAQFAHLFEQAVKRRLDTNQPVAVLVSGGLDSSAIITCANPQDIFGVTYGLSDGSGADEDHYVDALRARGYDIERVDFYPIADLAAIERSVYALEQPFADDVPATLERAAHAARQRGAPALMMGSWGDQVLSPFPPPLMQNIRPWRLRKLKRLASAFHRYVSDVPEKEVFNALLRASLRAYATRVLPRGVYVQRRRENVFDVLEREFGPPPPPLPAHSYREAVGAAVSDAEHVSALESTMKWGLANGIDVRLPFLDVELIQWLQSVPDHIAYHNYGLKPLLRAGLRDRLPPEIANRRDKGDYTRAIKSGRLPVATAVDALDGLRRLVDNGLMSSESAHATLANLSKATNICDEKKELASNLLAIDAWLRQFFEAR